MSSTLKGFIMNIMGKQTVATGTMTAKLLLPVVNSMSIAKMKAKDMLFSMHTRIRIELLK
jgi:hypothetical protein